ncbi:amidase [Malassezia japonica]|uniref:Amidase n=1 Tax=Malassezia japonica TaxID=223818 RepID=A0AAF0JBR9_9BASI|nr:amidase [Malassezia japonica]WFD40530.1 amidase [Malassezia japonica]
MLHDDVAHPQPPIRAALEHIADSLHRLGHEVIPFEPPSHAHALTIWLSIMAQTAGGKIHELCEDAGEPLVPEVAELMGEKRGDREPATAEEVWEQAEDRLAYTAEYDQAWNETAKRTQCKRPMDAILMPNTGVVAWERGGVNYFVGNVLHYSSVSMPLAKSGPVPQKTRDEFFNTTDEEVYHAYDPNKHNGMPIGIQLMGRRFQEEKVLALAKIVQDAVVPGSPARAVL